LVQKYELPTIFISQQTILQTGFNEHLLVGCDSPDDKFAFIVIPIVKADIVPNYKLIQNADGDAFISIKQLLDSSKVNEAILSVITPLDFLEKDVAIKPKRVRRKLIIASSSTSSLNNSSSISLDLDIAPNTKKRKKVIIKGNTKKRNK